jgi:hypothetical protein
MKLILKFLMKKILFPIVLCLAFFFSGCEKDDICDGSKPTTSRLVIEFYDFNNPAVLKIVPNLRVIGAGMTTPLIMSNTNKILIPLKTTEDNTEYSLTVNFGNPNTSFVFTDILDFNYTRKEEYLSRACGFKTTFTLNPSSNPPAPIILNNNPAIEEGSWIRDIQILSRNIETENETHVKIFF